MTCVGQETRESPCHTLPMRRSVALRPSSNRLVGALDARRGGYTRQRRLRLTYLDPVVACLNPLEALAFVLAVEFMVIFVLACLFWVLGPLWRMQWWSGFLRDGRTDVPSGALFIAKVASMSVGVAGAAFVVWVVVAWAWCIFFQPSWFQQLLSGFGAMATFGGLCRGLIDRSPALRTWLRATPVWPRRNPSDRSEERVAPPDPVDGLDD